MLLSRIAISSQSPPSESIIDEFMATFMGGWPGPQPDDRHKSKRWKSRSCANILVLLCEGFHTANGMVAI